jgi:hypothetical protein
MKKNDDGAFVFECTSCGQSFPRAELVEVEAATGVPMLGRVGVAPPMLQPAQAMVTESQLYCRPCKKTLDGG